MVAKSGGRGSHHWPRPRRLAQLAPPPRAHRPQITFSLLLFGRLPCLAAAFAGMDGNPKTMAEPLSPISDKGPFTRVKEAWPHLSWLRGRRGQKENGSGIRGRFFYVEL